MGCFDRKQFGSYSLFTKNVNFPDSQIDFSTLKAFGKKRCVLFL